ncbi:MAG: hypothetical protein AAGE85_06430 [Pseudomonadota bacterium]
MTILRIAKSLRVLGKALILLASGTVIVACASQDAKPPFATATEKSTSFWVISPSSGKTTFAFHWQGDTLHLLRTGKRELESYEVALQSCVLLRSYLIQFDQSLLDTVEMVFVRKPALPIREVELDGASYRARYVPKSFKTTMELHGGATKRTPWISAAEKVRDRAIDCIDNPGIRGNPPKAVYLHNSATDPYSP